MNLSARQFWQPFSIRKSMLFSLRRPCWDEPSSVRFPFQYLQPSCSFSTSPALLFSYLSTWALSCQTGNSECLALVPGTKQIQCEELNWNVTPYELCGFPFPLKDVWLTNLKLLRRQIYQIAVVCHSRLYSRGKKMKTEIWLQGTQSGRRTRTSIENQQLHKPLWNTPPRNSRCQEGFPQHRLDWILKGEEVFTR